MRDVVYKYTIPKDGNAPERLRGQVVTLTITPKGMRFGLLDMGDDLTPQEIGFFRWFTGEVMDKIKAKTGANFTERPLEFLPNEEGPKQ
jgi:hypothetical protein